MTTRAGRDLVTVRAIVASGLSLLLATLAHTSAGGLVPAWWLVLGMGLLCFAGSALWLDRQTSPASLALLLVGAQTTLHFEMTALAGHRGHHPTATTATGAITDALRHVSTDLVHDAPMVVTHALAAVAAGLLLGTAERALWTVLDLLRRAGAFVALALRALPQVTPTPAPAVPHTSADVGPRRTSLWLAATHVRRGPPALLPAR